MTRHLQLFIDPTIPVVVCICMHLLALVYATDKWSRQLEATAPGVSDSFDWVPVAQPVDGSNKDRATNARVLTYSQSFPPNGRFGDLSKSHNPPTSQQHPFDFPYQFQRFTNTPPRHSVGSPFGASALKPVAPPSPLQSDEPTSQSFFKFEMPFRTDSGNRGVPGSPSLQTGYQIHHTFGGGAQATLFNSPLFSQQPVFPPEFHPIPQKPIQQQLQHKPLPQQNFIEESYPTKNTFRESKPIPTQPSLQSVTPQIFPVAPQSDQLFDLNKPSSFQVQSPFQQVGSAPAAPFQHDASASAPASNGHHQQDVQLLYVPYDTLFNQHKPHSAFEANKYNVNPSLPTVNPFQINQFYTQDSLGSLDPQHYFTTSTSRPYTTTLKPTTIFKNYASPQLTTPKPKPKAHQPPLAMFLVRNSARPTQSDVVSSLRHSNTIAVIDAPTKNIPDIFVGPAGMTIPDGYVKFDLPYLSQLSQTRELREVPFFVAPLSYRTANGFNKILLPEPHVGSIVINLARSNSPSLEAINQPTKPGILYGQNHINQYRSPSPQRVRPQRVKQPSPTKEYHQGDILSEHVPKSRDPYEITTQRATLAPSRGNKFSYFYDQDAIHEVTSPKHDRPKKKRPQAIQQQPIEQPTFIQTINNPYAQFQPIPNQIINEDAYKVQPDRPVPSTPTSTSSTTTSTTTTTAAPAHSFFTFNPNTQIEFQSVNGPLYSFDTIPREPAEEHDLSLTTHPPTGTTPEEEFRMKQYYRQQDAYRNRPQIVNPTNPPFDQVHYTPVDLDYGRDVNVPSTTQKTTSSVKQRITFYSPSSAPAATPEETFKAVQEQPNVVEQQPERDTHTELKSHRKQPTNHHPFYNQNEIPDSTVEYEPNPYHVPSELPPLTPNLPGLVNNLQEKDKQNAVEELAATIPNQPEKDLPTRPTRRPINRVRKPIISKVTSSVSYSESETSTRRPSHRVRRPFGSRGSANSAADIENETSISTRRPPSAARNPLIRNPNRIRYQPTPEERQSLRTKQRKKYGESKKPNGDEDLDYQRDVLKQNYPLIKPLSSRNPSSPTAIPSSYATVTAYEGPTSETQQVYTVTPSNTVETSDQTFPAGMLESMQIAQQYIQYTKDNFGPGYFPNQEDLSPTEPIIRNEINPVFTAAPSTTTTTTTTTTEEPQVTTRRSPFIRRNYPRLRTTTTEVPTTTMPTIEVTPSLRPRIPPRKVIKVRARTRRPHHPASSTSNPEEEVEEEPKNSYRKINRFNHDLYENDASQTPRRRQRPSLQLDGQESQWSPTHKFGSNHNFKLSNAKQQPEESNHKSEDEPEIVTLGPENDKKTDNFEVKVSANLDAARPTLKAPNLKPEKSFAELLEEVMGKKPVEKPLDSVEEASTRTTDGTFFESQRTTIFNRINRRNKFKRLKPPSAHNNESFETAESQNIGAQLYNSLHGPEKRTDEVVKELQITTPLAPTVESKYTTITLSTTPNPLTTMKADEATTPIDVEVTSYATTMAMAEVAAKTTVAPSANENENATANESVTRHIDEAVDDLESQPSIFSEVKKQLHDLFAIDESEDHAVTAALAAVSKRRQEYMNIKRTKPDTTTLAMNDEVATTAAPTLSASAIKADGAIEAKHPFHKNLMEQAVYATSTSTKVTAETEICYRGRCIRSEDLPANHKLN